MIPPDSSECSLTRRQMSARGTTLAVLLPRGLYDLERHAEFRSIGTSATGLASRSPPRDGGTLDQTHPCHLGDLVARHSVAGIGLRVCKMREPMPKK